MADRTDYFFRQRVTEAELDLGFELLEQADRNLAADIGVWGIVSGAEPAQHDPLPDLTIDLTAPARAYDHAGRRVFFGTGQSVNCAVDYNGLPTEISSSSNERWLGVFLKFDRLLSDPRTDGNSQQVYFRRDESFVVIVRQAAEGPIGSAPKVPLVEDELLVCDVLRSAGQTQILDADIDLSRRQAFIFAQGDAVEIVSGLWNVLAPAVNTVQAAFDSVDQILGSHFDGSDHRHAAAHVDVTPHGFLASGQLQAAIAELVDKLSSTASGTPGTSLVGADAVPGTPHALAAGSTDGQLSLILGWLNDHLSAVSGAHNASAIAAAAHAYITSPSVQAQLQEIVQDLASQNSGLGASQVGDEAVGGSPNSLAAGSVRDQLLELLGHLNTHAGSDDHDTRYFTKTEADARYYNEGDQVDDADTVDGMHAADFAEAGHDHDDRYMRHVYSNNQLYIAGDTKLLTTFDEAPDVITSSYAYDSGTGPEATSYIRGALTPDVRVWITKIDVGDGEKDYELTVDNLTGYDLYIKVDAYQRS